MAGVVGWWDEDPGQAMDELAGMGGGEAARTIEKSMGDKNPFAEPDPVGYVEPLAKKDAEKIVHAGSVPAVMGTKTPTATKENGWVKLGGMINLNGINANSTTLTLDYVNITGSEYRRLKETEQAFKNLKVTADTLIKALMGLPSKEYRGIKDQLGDVAMVIKEAKNQGLI